MYYVAYKGVFYDVDVQDTQTQIIENDRISEDGEAIEDVVVAFGLTLEHALYSLGVPEDEHYIFLTPYNPVGDYA